MRGGPSGVFRFGNFELYPRTRELRREGKLVPLQFQPFKLLHHLLEQVGEVVTRQALKDHLWGDQTFVDFEAGLNFSIRQIRRALGESARSPALLQTYNRCGYRFVGGVEWVPAAQEIPLERNVVMKLDEAVHFGDRDAVTRLAEQIARMLVAACRQDSLLYDHCESIALGSPQLPAINVLLRPTGEELTLVLTAKS
jgi:DNA-binding winged helix-turn-helix (wHTH) protein